MNKIFTTTALLLLLLVASCRQAEAAAPHAVRWGDESADMARLDSIMQLPEVQQARGQARVAAIGRAFLGVPYVGGVLECEPEMLTIDSRRLDCTTYVELVLAIAKAVEQEGRNATANQVADCLRDMRYRRGTVDGYASRLHYITDWITDNAYRGNIVEVTPDLPGAKKRLKTLNFMTAHRDKYPVLAANDSLFSRMQAVEGGLRGCVSWYVPKGSLKSKNLADALREGDVVFLTTSLDGLDVTHAGIIVKDPEGRLRLMHASSAAGKVIVDPLPLDAYQARIKAQDGIRVIRLKQ